MSNQSVASPRPLVIAEFLRGTEMFAWLDSVALEELAGVLEVEHVAAGDVLMHRGEPADAVFIVVGGRLRATVAREEGLETVVGEIGRGEVVGEMALLSDEPRSATVCAVRDSHLYRLSKDAFSALCDRHPQAVLGIAALIVRRLQRTMHTPETTSAISTVAVAPVGAGVRLDVFCRRLADALGQMGSTLVVTAKEAGAQFDSGVLDADGEGSPSAQFTQWLDRLEAQHTFVVMQCDHISSPWTRRCLRQADRILLTADGDRPPETEGPPLDRGVAGPRVELVLQHGAATRDFDQTRAWLDTHTVAGHHHLRRSESGDYARLARTLAGRSVGLVLGGGGARGFAHLGVLRALEETQIPIDVVAGTSFGAVVAACIAMGWDSTTTAAILRDALVEGPSTIDLTAPAVALTSGNRLTEVIRSAFGDIHIEDLRHAFFCVSTDLSAGDLVVHDSGPLWQAVRASVALPGIFPPIRSPNGNVLVDGGVMNNLPVDIMRTRVGTGTVLAVDLQAGAELPVQHLPDDGILSGWRILSRRVNPLTASPKVPGIVSILLRVTEVASEHSQRRLQDNADLIFQPPVKDFALLDFKAHQEIIETGYQHAHSHLQKRPGTHHIPMTDQVPSTSAPGGR